MRAFLILCLFLHLTSGKKLVKTILSREYLGARDIQLKGRYGRRIVRKLMLNRMMESWMSQLMTEFSDVKPLDSLVDFGGHDFGK